MSTPSLANYVLGQSVHEYERLMLQGRFLRPYTEKFFRAAGVVPGMRVLDVGSGMGDVSLLAADIVGPGGRVLGIDRDAAALDNARRRAVEQGCSSWVSFQSANLDEFETPDKFDALLGRYVLLYQPDATASLRRLLRYLDRGGIVVFHDIDFTNSHPTSPPCPLFDQVYALLGEAFRRTGAPPDFGRRLGKTFVDAGLPFPEIMCETVVGGGKGSYIYPWITNTFISIAPRLEALGLTLPLGIPADQALSERMEEEAVRLGSQIIGPAQFGAWARKQ
jgi:ubiquinone/menaquinone biosynthesis C-methylase UbiE